MAASKPESAAPFAYEGLDRVIHERARLSILTSLMTHAEGLSFVELKQKCALTDGNLARHLQVLQEEEMVRVAKGEDRGRPQTNVQVTAAGRQRFLAYLTTLEQVVKDASASVKDSKHESRVRSLLPIKV